MGLLSSLGKAVSGNLASGSSKTGLGILSGNLSTGGLLSRLRGMNLPPGGETALDMAATAAENLLTDKKDWRVRLSLPAGYEASDIIAPLVQTNGFVFPFTPTIDISQSATYNPIDVVHNNYPFFAYQNSKIDPITITGEFYCENADDARYWIAAVHYLRSVTKMAYGKTSNQGAPPPMVKLNGYGDFVFKNVPVVVTSFSINLSNSTDYISTSLTQNLDIASINIELPFGLRVGANYQIPLDTPLLQKVSWVPVKSSFTVTVQPLYTREQVRYFSQDDFISGKYVFNGRGYM